MITLSFYDQQLALIDKGEFDDSRLDELLNERLSNAGLTFDDGEMAVSCTAFILSRSEKDFIEVMINHKGSVVFYSDRLCYTSGILSTLKKMFCDKHHLSFEVDIRIAKTVCQDYLKLDRQAFENKYQMFYSR